jgi:hypothetical protein
LDLTKREMEGDPTDQDLACLLLMVLHWLAAAAGVEGEVGEEGEGGEEEEGAMASCMVEGAFSR